VTCRVARLFQRSTQMEPVSCCECDSTHLEMLSTSNTVGPYLCQTCAQSRVESDVEESMARSPMTGQPVT
jgi:hypothetical protein